MCVCVCVCVYSAKAFSVLSLSHLPSFSLSFSFSTCLFYTISILLASTFRIFYFIFLFSSFFVDILRLFCPDDYIPEDSPVRILDAFVNSLNLEELGYITFASSAPGQQPYSRFDLIKLHLYGYINGIRSSRKLAAECSRNIELMWLINGISPSKSLISDFVKVNETAIQNTFKEFVLFLKFAGFVDNKAIVIDGTKIRAQNSHNKYYSIKKIDSTI